MDAVVPLDRAERFGLAPPPLALSLLEWRAALDVGRLLAAVPQLRSQPRGDGRRLVLLPGYLTDDRVMWPLKRYLSWLGYDVVTWGLGLNRGQPYEDTERMAARLPSLVGDDGQATLIGWSLGGSLARLVTRERPDLVREVITFGSPVEGGPKYTIAGKRFADRRGVDIDQAERDVHALNSDGLSCPVTVIYSRTDGIVSWSAAIDRYNPGARHVRVRGSHLGLGLNPDVWRVIAETLHRSRR